MIKTLFVLFAVCTVALGEQLVPIPPAADGYLIGPSNATFELEVFIDLLCPDSQAAWPVLKKLINDVKDNGVSLRVHIFPLPYHDAAYLFAHGASFFHLNGTVEDVLTYIDLSFEVQDNYSNDLLANLTKNEIIARWAQEVSARLPNYSVDRVVRGLTQRVYDLDSRVSWKYACHRGITGTPIFLANGVTIDNAGSFDYVSWIDFLQDYVSIPNAKKLTTRAKLTKRMMNF